MCFINITVATTLRPQNISTPLGDIEYRHLAMRYFFGFDERRMAYAEKAMLDLIYMRTRRGIREYPEMWYADMLNKRKLVMYAKKFSPHVQRKCFDFVMK